MDFGINVAYLFENIAVFVLTFRYKTASHITIFSGKTLLVSVILISFSFRIKLYFRKK